MRLLVLSLLLPALARAQDGAAERDPASLFPIGTPIYAELEGLSAAAEAVKGSGILDALDEKARKDLDAVLDDLAGLEVRRAVIGVLPALILSTRWIVL